MNREDIKEQFLEGFKQIDFDGDGYISSEDLKKFLATESETKT